MKKTTTLLLFLLTSCFILLGTEDRSILLEEDANAACTCDKNNDLAVLKELYDNNGGASWNLAPGSSYQDLLFNSGNFAVPNAGNPWNVNAPNAENQMGSWHGVRTNQAGCVTEIILWSGIYNGGNGVGVTGNLPASLNQLCALQKLMLPHNDITGPLPADLDDLCNLQVLLLQNNELEGPLPPEVGNMNNLVHLALHDNAFTGTLPSVYMDIPELLILHLRGNKLEGEIPSNVGNLDKLVLFDISDNCLSGTVPATIALMGQNSTASASGRGLLQLNLQNNKLDSLPDVSSLVFGRNPNRSFDISGNHFTFDDIIPNRNILTKYDNQTIDLDLYYCLQIGDAIVIKPGFDEIIDQQFYGPFTRSQYTWARGTNFSTVSNINQISFTNASLNSAGNFTIEVTNRLAPDLTLLASNLVIDVLDPTITGMSTVCMGTSTTLGLNNSYANYDWSTGENTDTILINTVGTYSVTVTNDNGCTATRSIEVVESESPPIFISKTNDIDCENDIAQVFSTTSSPDISYTWTDALGNILGTNTLLDVVIPGFYTLTIANTEGCTSEASIEVTGSEDIETPQIEGNLSFCEGESSLLTVTGDYASYTWSTGASTPTLTVDSTGTYIVTVTSSTGCMAVNSTNVVVTELPSFSLVGTQSFCPGASTILTIDSTYTTYNWSNGDTSQNAIITMPGNYEVTVTNASNCSSILAFTVDVSQPPIASINGDSTICAGNSISLFGSPLNNTYDWSTGESGPFILASAAGTYGLTVTDGNGCTSSTTKTLTEIAQPPLQVLGDTLICKEESTMLTVVESYASYLWSTGSNNQTITIDTAGAYTVTITNSDGCQNQLTHIVTELSGPNIPSQEEVIFCSGETITLQAQEGFAQYQWANGEDTSFIDVNQEMNYFVTVTDQNGCTGDMVFIVKEEEKPAPQITGEAFLCEGTVSILSTTEEFDNYLWSDGSSIQTLLITTPDTYSVTVSNANGCTETTSFVVAESPDINFNIIGNTAICAGESTTLRSDDDYADYLWSTGDNTSSIAVSSAGTYTLTVTNNEGCTGEQIISVIENDILFPQIVGNDFICQGGNTIISADDDYTSYVWSTGVTSKDLLVSSVGTYQLIVTNAAGCTGEVSIDIIEAPVLQPNITGANTFCAGTSANLGLDTIYSSYIWSTGATTESIEVTEGTYTVTISNTDGCTGTAQIQVEEQAIFKPSITAQDSAMCANGINILVAQEGFLSYHWEAVNTNNNLPPLSTVFIIQPDTYILTVTDASGCQGIDSIIIAEYEAVKLAPGAADPICMGDTIATKLSLPGFASYLWSTGDTTSSIFVNTGGIYEVIAENEFGCSDTTFYEVTEYQPPIVNVNNAGDSIINLCKGEETILFGVIDNTFDYRWENESGDQIGLTPVLEVDKPGTYSLVVVDNITGCVTTESTHIQALPNPVELNIDTISRHLDCENRVTLLDASDSKNVDFFSWQKPEDTGISFLAQGPEVSSYEVNSAGNYRIIVEDQETSCKDTAMIIVTENIDTLSPTIVKEGSLNIIDALQVCEGDVAQIRVKDTYQKYEWHTGETTQNLDAIIDPGTYMVTVTDGRSCTGSTSVKVLTKQPEDIRVEIASDISDICEGEQVKINFNILSGGTGPYDISYTDGVNEDRLGNIADNVGSIFVTPTSNSVYEITDIVDQGNNCFTTNSIDTAFLTFNINEKPIAHEILDRVCAGTDTNEGNVDLTNYDDDVSGDFNLPVNWYYQNNLDSEITNTSEFLTPSTTIYASVLLGACESDLVPVTLEVDDCGNSLELTHESGTALDLSYLDGEKREVYITNRWGDLVFASSNYEEFDNKFIGSDLPQGAYYIYIKNFEKGLPVPYKGVIYLLKEQ